jgi:hypothetical protein
VALIRLLSFGIEQIAEVVKQHSQTMKMAIAKGARADRFACECGPRLAGVWLMIGIPALRGLWMRTRPS